MRRARILLSLGIWVAILPYLGFPYFWKNILLSLAGLWLMFISFLLYKEWKAGQKSESFDNFSENSDFAERETPN